MIGKLNTLEDVLENLNDRIGHAHHCPASSGPYNIEECSCDHYEVEKAMSEIRERDDG